MKWKIKKNEKNKKMKKMKETEEVWKWVKWDNNQVMFFSCLSGSSHYLNLSLLNVLL